MLVRARALGAVVERQTELGGFTIAGFSASVDSPGDTTRSSAAELQKTPTRSVQRLISLLTCSSGWSTRACASVPARMR
jgi:hypothetical protein